MSVLSVEEVIEKLTNPERLYSCEEVLVKPSPVPKESGVYAWYFKDIPPLVPTDGCAVKDGKTLLYVGSAKVLRVRIRKHCDGEARRSTLRMSLGALLHENLPDLFYKLDKKNTKKYHYPENGEDYLSLWMKENAFVCWVEYENENYASVEEDIIEELRTPFNKRRGEVRVSGIVGDMRDKARQKAKELK